MHIRILLTKLLRFLIYSASFVSLVTGNSGRKGHFLCHYVDEKIQLYPVYPARQARLEVNP